MNFAPLDCSCQGASSEPKKIFSVLPKNQKMDSKNFNGRNSTPVHYTITDSKSATKIVQKKAFKHN
jgi:hypothetical protein